VGENNLKRGKSKAHKIKAGGHGWIQRLKRWRFKGSGSDQLRQGEGGKNIGLIGQSYPGAVGHRNSTREDEISLQRERKVEGQKGGGCHEGGGRSVLKTSEKESKDSYIHEIRTFLLAVVDWGERRP